MIRLTDDVRRAVDRVIRERFGGKVEEIEIEIAEDDTGEEVMLIRVVMSSDTTSSDFSGKFFGLTGRIRNALGAEMRDVFPVIRPVQAHA